MSMAVSILHKLGEIFVFLRKISLWAAVFFLALINDARALAKIGAVTMKSPSGKIAVDFGFLVDENRKTEIVYKVSFGGETLVKSSLLGLDILRAKPFGEFSIKKVRRSELNDKYKRRIGKSSLVNVRYNEIRVELEERKQPRRTLIVVFRMFNDGVAFRYVIPKQKSLSHIVLSEEKTQFSLADGANVYALALPIGVSSYEGFYKIQPIELLSGTFGLPLLAESPGGAWVAITEAALTSYAGLYLAKELSSPDIFKSRLAPSPNQSEVKVQGVAPFLSPWRVIMIGNSNRELLESNLVNSLNEPSILKNTSWIRTGKVQFPWWNGYVVPSGNGGLNTRTLKHYIDFCAAHGIEYHSIDGYEFDQAWYGGKVAPYNGADITKSIPEIDLPEVLRYAREKGVGTRLWLHSDALRAVDLDQVFSLYEEWGIHGIMVDFLDRDDQEAVRFYHRILRSAAKHHLTVSFHGVFKPTGLERTYPHLLNHEAVLGAEYNKWSEVGSPPDHEVLIAFIRMLVGPLDTHQGSFRPVSMERYKPSSIAPSSIGTLARQIAMYVVYENPLPMLSDYPEAYTAQPEAFRFVRGVPVVWDETRMLSGEIGKFITIARRSGEEWFLGNISGTQPRDLQLPLSFLGYGDFIAEIYRSPSAIANPEKVVVETVSVTRADSLAFKLGPADGFAVRIYRKPQ